MFRKGLAIAGIRGGSGKTVVSMGIARALHRRGIGVAPFKKGPDYIDPGWLGAAAGRPCYNLDSYLFGRRELVSSFLHSNPQCPIALIEGNRGLYDGVDSDGTHSIAEMAKSLGIPLILVADCTKSTRTVAALIHGCRTFDPAVPLEGVILNNISGERHRRVIVRSIEDYAGVKVLGAVPRLDSLDLPERRLGLVTVREVPESGTLIDSLADIIEESADIDALIRLAGEYHYRDFGGPDIEPVSMPEEMPGGERVPVIGVMLDRAFSFYYPDTLEYLEKCGARTVTLDALKDRSLPQVDALYVGGGFPENHAAALAGNGSLRGEIRAAVEDGLPVYAECGGLIYLSEAVHCGDSVYPMAGVFPYRFAVEPRPQSHGYVEFVPDVENLYYEKGAAVKGHEFRYSRIIGGEASERCPTVFRMNRGNGIAGGRDGAVYRRALGTFCHTHPRSAGVGWMRNIVKLARERTAVNG